MNRWGPRIGCIILIGMIFMAAAAPLLAPYDPYKDMDTPYLSPGREHLLGTNDIGQDILSEIIYGTRTSLAVGSISAVIAIFLGTVIGMVSGWYGGMIDRLFAKITAFFMTLPFLPTMILLSALTKPGIRMMAVILGVMSWTGTARIVRSQVLGIRKKEYIQTIKAMGAKNSYILYRHVLRELLPYLMYQGTARVRSAILTESSLSFLGLGNAATKSWGTIIYYAQAKNALLTDRWIWWILPPGICIILVSCALMMITYGLEEQTDGRLESEG